MKDWNVVVNLKEKGFRTAMDILGRMGRVGKTEYYNVLVMNVADIGAFLEELRQKAEARPYFLRFISRLVPVTEAFLFNTPDEFEDKAGKAVMKWIPLLAGKKFHVRMHRRGFKGELKSLEEERFLDTFILGELGRAGQSARVSFDDPDYIIALETVDDRAGLSIWARDELKKYPFIRPD
jgi:tRNA(Ser,Leu) C12 N-acetylase TAN1